MDQQSNSATVDRPYSYELVTQSSGETNQTMMQIEMGSKKMQYMAGCIGSLGVLGAGVSLSWSSPANAKMSHENPHASEESPVGPVDDSGLSWVGSFITVGAIFGPWIAVFLVDRLGRKTSLLLTTIPFCLGWILIGTAKSLLQIYIARVLSGLGVGIIFTVLPMYLGEIAEDEIRGALGSFLQLFITFGLLYSYVIGPYVSWVVLSILSIIIPIAFGVTFFFMPESPIFYISKGRKEEAEQSLMKLRGKSAFGVKDELAEMQDDLAETMKQKGSIRDLFATTGNRKAMLLSLGLVAFQQLSGINVVLFYTQDIFAATKSSLAPEISTIIVGIVQVLASCVTPLVVDRLGRRMLLLISGIGMTIALGLLGMFFYFQNHDLDTSSMGALPVVAMVGYMCVYCIGFGPLPWAVMGELFPANIKSIASTCTASFCWLLAFFITKYFNLMPKEVGFWLFAVCSLIAAVFVFLLLPETKGKSLQEIQDILNGKK